jgi:hypothetical protein
MASKNPPIRPSPDDNADAMVGFLVNAGKSIPNSAQELSTIAATSSRPIGP